MVILNDSAILHIIETAGEIVLNGLYVLNNR